MTPSRPGRPAIGEPVQIRLPADMLADVDRLARAEGVTRSQWVRQALAARVAASNPPGPKGFPCLHAQGDRDLSLSSSLSERSTTP